MDEDFNLYMAGGCRDCAYRQRHLPHGKHKYCVLHSPETDSVASDATPIGQRPQDRVCCFCSKRKALPHYKPERPALPVRNESGTCCTRCFVQHRIQSGKVGKGFNSASPRFQRNAFSPLPDYDWHTVTVHRDSIPAATMKCGTRHPLASITPVPQTAPYKVLPPKVVEVLEQQKRLEDKQLDIAEKAQELKDVRDERKLLESMVILSEQRVKKPAVHRASSSSAAEAQSVATTEENANMQLQSFRERLDFFLSNELLLEQEFKRLAPHSPPPKGSPMFMSRTGRFTDLPPYYRYRCPFPIKTREKEQQQQQQLADQQRARERAARRRPTAVAQAHGGQYRRTPDGRLVCVLPPRRSPSPDGQTPSATSPPGANAAGVVSVALPGAPHCTFRSERPETCPLHGLRTELICTVNEGDLYHTRQRETPLPDRPYTRGGSAAPARNRSANL